MHQLLVAKKKLGNIVVSIEIELAIALENAQLPAFSSLLQLISRRNDYITEFFVLNFTPQAFTLSFLVQTTAILLRQIELYPLRYKALLYRCRLKGGAGSAASYQHTSGRSHHSYYHCK